MDDKNLNIRSQCALVVAALSEERGWNLTPEQQQAYVHALDTHLPATCTPAYLRVLVTYYHQEHNLVQSLQNTTHPQHTTAWNTQMEQILNILRRERLAWMHDTAVDMEDLVQIALLELVHSIPNYHYTSRFSTWAYSVIVRRIKRYFRDRNAQKRAVIPLSLEANPDIDPSVQATDTLEAIAEGNVFASLINTVLVGRNGQRAADIFHMWATEDVRLEEIGKRMQCSSSWVRILLNEARTVLQHDPAIQEWLHETNKFRLSR